MSAVVAAIIAGVATLAGGGLSAYGASKSAEEQERIAGAAQASTDEQFQQQMEEQRLSRITKGMDMLAQQRGMANAYATTRRFGADMAKAFATYAPPVKSTSISAPSEAPKVGV